MYYVYDCRSIFMTPLTPCQRLAPRLVPLIGKSIPYTQLWKILTSVPGAYVEYENGMTAIWHTKFLKRKMVTVEYFYGRTGLQSSYIEPVMHSVVVRIKVENKKFPVITMMACMIWMGMVAWIATFSIIHTLGGALIGFGIFELLYLIEWELP
jgi:hypothetical protein